VYFLSSLTVRSALLLSIVALGAGCAAGDSESDGAEQGSQAIVSQTVVVADQAATSSANVEEGRVVLPAAAGAKYRDIRPGTIFVGARGDGGKNPDGFLRRVESVTVSATEVVIATKPATLTEAIVDGGLKASSGGGRSLDGDGENVSPLTASSKDLKAVEIDFADQPLFENVDEIETAKGKTRFTESITLDRATIYARPSVDIDLRIRDNHVSRFVAMVEGEMDTSVRAAGKVTVEGDVDDAVIAELRSRHHEVRRVIYQSPRVPLPTLSIGRVPVSPSVTFTVTLACDLSFGGAFSATAGVEAKSYVRLGGVFDNGQWKPPIKSEFDIKPTFAIDHAGAVDARCGIETQAELWAYGTSGVSLSVAPYVDFAVTNAASLKQPYPYTFKVDAGASGVMHGRADVFGVKQEDLERALVEWKTATPLTGVAR
jgi:hypothetical protein